MRILSIDFDYFIDTTIDVRNECFPDGNDNLPSTLVKFIWERRYAFYNNIKNIGLITDYDRMCQFLKNLTGGKVLIADSHKEIEKLFSEIKPNEDLDLVHIDFHHDMYITGGNTLDCGNWLRFLLDLKPDTKITWVRREDSDLESLDGTFPYDNTTNISTVKGEFDFIFMCFSSPWTPPHLYNDFLEMTKILSDHERF